MFRGIDLAKFLCVNVNSAVNIKVGYTKIGTKKPQYILYFTITLYQMIVCANANNSVIISA